MLKPFKETRIPVASNASPCRVSCVNKQESRPHPRQHLCAAPSFFSSSNPALRCSPLLPLPPLLHLCDVIRGLYLSLLRGLQLPISLIRFAGHGHRADRLYPLTLPHISGLCIKPAASSQKQAPFGEQQCLASGVQLKFTQTAAENDAVECRRMQGPG